MALTKEEQAFKDEVDAYRYKVREAVKESKALINRGNDMVRRFNKLEKELKGWLAQKETKND